MTVYPLVLEPVLVAKIWGGRGLERLFDRPLPSGEKIGESWEVADLPEGVTPVATGPDAGRSLHDMVAAWGERLVGTVPLVDGRFPLLIKFLDAEEVLSVQVHPDEAACAQIGGDARVKHEAWYVIEARDDAVIYAGLKPGTTREQFEAAVADGTVADKLQRIEVRAGDCYYLPSGTVHALGAGVMVAEVQTPSDTTYRVFDWNRLSDDGKPRALHVDHAKMCIHFDEPPPTQQPRRHESDPWTTTTRLAECPRFIMDKVRTIEGYEQPLAPGSMAIWMVLAGRFRLTTAGSDAPQEIRAGQTVVIPADVDETVLAVEADATWIRVTVPT